MLNQWAARHGVSAAAIAELRCLMIRTVEHPPELTGKNEAAASQMVRIAASKSGARLYRNNVGAGTLDNGSFLRWGLANESAAMNKEVKSGDLIGIRPMLITPAHIGRTIGQFVSREVKSPGWKYGRTAHERAQLRWIEIVTALGGDAAFTTGGWE